MKKFLVFLPGISRLISNTAPLILLFIFTKFVTIEEIGVLNYFAALITILGVLTDFGLPEAVQTFVTQNKNKNLIFSTIVFEFIVVVIASIICFIINLLFNDQLFKNEILLMILVILFSSSNTIVITFNALEKHSRVTFYYLLSSILFVILTLFFYFTKTFNIEQSFLIARLISWVVITIIPILDLIRSGNLDFKFDLPRRYLKFAFNNLVVALSYITINNWDSIIITNSLGSYQNGIYQSVFLLASIPYALSTIVSTRLLPTFSKLYEEGKLKQISEKLRIYRKALFSILLVIFVIFALFGEQILSIFYNPTIASNGSKYFLIVFLAVSAYIMATPSAIFLQAAGKENILRDLSIINALAFFVSTTLLTQTFGVFFIAVLFLILNLGYFGVTLLFTRRDLYGVID